MKKKILNRNNRVTSILFIILMVFLALSCNNMIDLGQGSLAVALPGGRSADGHLYTIEVASPTGITQTRTARGGQVVQFDGLSPNSYTVTVTGREFSDDDDEVGTVVYYGTSTASVTAGASASATVNLGPVVRTFKDLQNAVSAGGTVYVGSNIEIEEGQQFIVRKNVVLKAAHKDVTISATTGISLFLVNGGNLTLGGGEHTLIVDGNNKAGTTGINVSAGEATLNSNAIIQNCKLHAVSVGFGTFTLYGGTIKNNTSTTQGAGVYVNPNGQFIMNSGSITGNKSEQGGGGVCINERGSFTMNGGSITGNSDTKNWGGGVYVNGGTFTYTAGAISGNTSYDVSRTGGKIVGTLPDGTISNEIIN